MKIAVSTNGTQIDDHFGHCEAYTIFVVNEKKEIESTEILPSESGCGCKSNIASVLQNKGVNILIAGSMGDGALNVLNTHGIKVLRGNSGEARRKVDEFLDGKLADSGITCMLHGDQGHTCSH
ncbi:MAG: dinitrogenase iron-molybdenum cofactor biosynthesis protein [Bacteroidales bacterium 45-6]|nr:MAG: dinitrogenase iron-molybdenum cofactor biosynthesis protein [Bacteroidales bacterium 45-6]